MKLKSNGWSLREMLIFTSILLMFLLIVVVLIMRFYDNLGINGSGSSVDYGYYHNIEDEMILKSKKYVNDKNIDISNVVNIYLDDLVNSGYMKVVKDSKTNVKCDGYVSLRKSNNEINARSYLSCDNYESDGYIG